MTIDVKVPNLPESVADATVATWHLNKGDFVKRDQNIVDLETDKVVLEVLSPADGVLSDVLFKQGDLVKAGQLLATLDDSQKAAGTGEQPSESHEQALPLETKTKESHTEADEAVSPSVRRLLSEHAIEAKSIKGTGKEGRLTKEDVLAFIEAERSRSQKKEATPSPAANDMATGFSMREEKRVPMSRLRAKIAERLVSAQHNAAMLTTFNEVDLQEVMNLRATYKDVFEKKHGVKLGFMSFFTKAVVAALERFPAVNASIDGDDIVYHGYCDIGIAVSTDRGLVVPVVRSAEHLGMAEIEKVIQDAASRARAGKLQLEEMQGGTFTITNGGVFGSLLATPIINPPQTAILGMHKIQERPVVVNKEIVIRPMMYLALSYDHRLIDGKESVQFLVTVKELLENPSRLLLDV